MTQDEQASARLVAMAIRMCYPASSELFESLATIVRKRAGFKNPRAGSWCAAGLTAAMEDAGLVVPAPGTPARRGAVALIDWGTNNPSRDISTAQPGDIIAWLQYPPGKDPAGWRRGHVALIVAVDDESITTVGWNEGAAPGRVMKRRLWRDTERKCNACNGHRKVQQPRGTGMGAGMFASCRACKGTGKVPRSSTVLYRKPNGMLYGIARPVAR